jgi:hypothetical protein
VAPGSRTTVRILNGTFSKSENAIARDRIADLSLVGPGGRKPLDPAAWTEQDPMSTLELTLGEPGTYVLGAAIKPRTLSLPGKDFNAYLKEEGIDAILAIRQKQGQLDVPSKERYSKYVKAMLQSGDVASDAYKTVLGHDAEIVPLDNPYALKPGHMLRVKCVIKGRPLARYTVFAGGRKHGADVRLPGQRLETDTDGVARVRLTSAGLWYVKLVHMEPVTAPDAHYESRWATLTFAIDEP